MPTVVPSDGPVVPARARLRVVSAGWVTPVDPGRREGLELPGGQERHRVVARAVAPARLCGQSPVAGGPRASGRARRRVRASRVARILVVARVTVRGRARRRVRGSRGGPMLVVVRGIVRGRDLRRVRGSLGGWILVVARVTVSGPVRLVQATAIEMIRRHGQALPAILEGAELQIDRAAQDRHDLRCAVRASLEVGRARVRAIPAVGPPRLDPALPVAQEWASKTVAPRPARVTPAGLDLPPRPGTSRSNKLVIGRAGRRFVDPTPDGPIRFNEGAVTRGGTGRHEANVRGAVVSSRRIDEADPVIWHGRSRAWPQAPGSGAAWPGTARRCSASHPMFPLRVRGAKRLSAHERPTTMRSTTKRSGSVTRSRKRLRRQGQVRGFPGRGTPFLLRSPPRSREWPASVPAPSWPSVSRRRSMPMTGIDFRMPCAFFVPWRARCRRPRPSVSFWV